MSYIRLSDHMRGIEVNEGDLFVVKLEPKSVPGKRVDLGVLASRIFRMTIA